MIKSPKIDKKNNLFLAKKWKLFNYIFSLPFDYTDDKPYSFMYFKNKVSVPEEKKKKKDQKQQEWRDEYIFYRWIHL